MNYEVYIIGDTVRLEKVNESENLTKMRIKPILTPKFRFKIFSFKNAKLNLSFAVQRCAYVL